MNHMHTAYCDWRLCGLESGLPRYIVVPAAHSATWGDLMAYTKQRYGVWGNDFIGSRQFTASSGALVFKLDN